MDIIIPNGIIGSDRVRVDGVAKVTGTARYGADHALPDATHAALATSPIARGRIRRIDDSAARAMPGVLEILTYENVGKAVKAGKIMAEHGYMSGNSAPLSSDRILFSGQITAVVVAETLEIAQAAAAAIRFDYDIEVPSASFDAQGARVVKPQALGETELSAGKFEKAWKRAPVCVDAWYETPAYEPADGAKPAYGRTDMGHRLGAVRGHRDRPAAGALRQPGSGRVPRPGLRRHRADRDDHAQRRGQPGESAGD